MASWVDTPRCCGGVVAGRASRGHLLLVVYVTMSLHIYIWLILAFGWFSTGTTVELEPATFTVDNG
jgi:hypothetical protein